ncbi:hypothetical protein [Pseudarthrobacter sp. GA104]|uniref:hypothetical protein n=1 Tax=Pseudarthrobacter sp. GA104 TaxID=2676311 RepID=UPI0012F93F8D|nr:hypothetical protein [Pseudarthrobacter sp. GA104]MUU73417.1 hypothetical protein [Pseudarthrobacter sp. GA104]
MPPNWAGEWSDVFVQASADFIEDPRSADQAYQAEWKEYSSKLAIWQAEHSDLEHRTEVRAQASADAWEKEFRASTTDLVELTSVLVENLFPANLRDEAHEVNLWRDLFEWDSVSYELYPGWWISPELKRPLEPPDSILNASWARIYLPVTPGAEDLAMRWLYGGRLSEKRRQEVVRDIVDFRTKNFGLGEVAYGSESNALKMEQKYMVLAEWDDLMPTDGTHVEILRSSTTAAGISELRQMQADVQRKSALTSVVHSLKGKSARVNVDLTEPGTK